MALGKAIAVGAVASLAIPYATRGLTGKLGDWIAGSTLHWSLAGHSLHWNWPIFCLVTLLAWGLFRAAE